MKKFFLLLGLFAAVAGGWYGVSPWLAMKGLRDASADANREELARRIDFAAVRGSVKLQLRQRMEPDAQSGRPNVLERIGGAIARGAADGAVDLAVTPEGMAAIITTGALASPLLPAEMTNQDIEWSVEREGINRFRGVPVLDEGESAPVLIFDRDGFSWKLVDVELP